MNIYLDIDGVLLANSNRAADKADEFLEAALTKYPDSTYWLTPHYKLLLATSLVLLPLWRS